MKRPNFILSLLIPGPKAPGGDMDVYLEPLVDDLVDMYYHGVKTFDASKSEIFDLRASILCTINDFPGLGFTHGCATQGEVACPECQSFTCSLQLKKAANIAIWDTVGSYHPIISLDQMKSYLMASQSIGQHLYLLPVRKLMI